MIREQVARPVEFPREGRAFQSGWRDGRFDSAEVSESNLGPENCADRERRDYCRGYHEGRRIRELLRNDL